MHRLNGEDSLFLSVETPDQPMNSQVLVLFRPPRDDLGRPQPLDEQRLAVHVTERLGDLPAFLWRVVPVPFGLHHEVAINDPDFDVRHHLRRLVVAPPGGPTQLAEACDQLASGCFDRSRPLWEIVLLDGLADGRQGLVLRFQHALGDGGPTMAYLDILLGEIATPGGPPEYIEPIPTRAALALAACRDQAMNIRRAPSMLARSVRGLKAQRHYKTTHPVSIPRVVRDTPPTRLNDTFTSARRQSHFTLPMHQVRLIKQVSGASVTQVVLAVVSGGLRRYLAESGELPDKPLVAGLPVALRNSNRSSLYGNHFVNVRTALATDIADPWERLDSIRRVTSASVESLQVFGHELAWEWIDILPPWAARGMARWQLYRCHHDRANADTNVNVSVLRGPRRRWEIEGAQVDELYLFGPPNTGCALSITVYDYDDRLWFGLHACADAVEDLTSLDAALVDALDELAVRARQLLGVAS